MGPARNLNVEPVVDNLDDILYFLLPLGYFFEVILWLVFMNLLLRTIAKTIECKTIILKNKILILQYTIY